MSFRSWLKDKTGFDYKDGHDWAVAPVTGLYALGGALNELTGGNTAEWNPFRANDPGGSAGTTYSTFTKAASGYTGDTPGSGTLKLPVLNRNSAQLVHDVVDEALDPFGLDFSKLKWAALGLAAVLVATRD